MSAFFAPQGEPTAPWFRLGRLEVTTVMLVVLGVVVSWLAWVLVPSLPQALFYWPDALGSGELWRPFTWPLANTISVWGVLNLFFFWYFGTELERQVGRGRMARLLVGVWASLTVAATLVGLLFGGQALAGIGLVQFVVLLLWIAEYPNRPFFFGIPAWIVGLVLVGVQALVMIASRDGAQLLALLLSLVLVAIVGRRAGLLGEYPWIPGRPGAKPAKAKARPRPATPRSREQRREQTDRERLDALLDQINAEGIHSLTEAQRKEMKRLSERLRRS